MRTGSCGFAEPGESLLAAAQWLADEMRRHVDRSSHAHKGPAHGNAAITGKDSLFLPVARSQDRTVFRVDTYVYPLGLVYDDTFHVLSLAYPGDRGAWGRFIVVG